MRNLIPLALFLLCLLPGARRPLRAASSQPEVSLIKTPDGGIQPQAVLDSKSVLHLIYFKGDPAAGDIYYVKKAPGARSFSKPIRVNSVPGSAVAIGSVRGAQLAIGKNGIVNVAWFGSSKAQPRGPSNSTPMLYTRSNAAGTAFGPERNVMQFATGLDGGGSVAAGPAGNVYVAWHGNPNHNGEANRRVYVAKSSNNGKSFAREVPAFQDPTGACGCCGMRIFVGRQGDVYILYRAATEKIHRDMYLLVSTDKGRTFKGIDVSKWLLDACPMSTDFISESPGRILIAWERAGQVYYGAVTPGSDHVRLIVPAPGQSKDRKHPVVVGNANGDTLLAWTEGTAWQKGGALAWQVFDKSGKPLPEKGIKPGTVPVWGLVAAIARPDGGFAIIY